ncbi:hypothetical protein [Kitasatospora sp. NPDC007106]|uniref:hypothetical protein n=1 Tax=Kitasatospora sp. NPDC007106 TaxID=3156914 RepID=UPI0033F63FF1
MTDDTLRIPRVTAPRPDAPVFVDGSGRRRRLVRRAGWLLTVPAVGYLGLLASSLVGGPVLDAPFLPALPAHTATPAATVPAESPVPAAAGSEPASGPAGAAGPTGTRSTATTRPTVPATRTTAPATPQPTATATTVPSPTHGRSTAQPGRKPTKTP